jgi:membrane protease subunit HflC
MTAERNKEAQELRSTGKEKAEKIRASADRERTIELANAYRDAEELRGQGDADAARIYAEAYEQDPEFYAFVRSLNAYKSSFSNKGDILLVEPDSDFFKYLNQQKGQ